MIIAESLGGDYARRTSSDPDEGMTDAEHDMIYDGVMDEFDADTFFSDYSDDFDPEETTEEELRASLAHHLEILTDGVSQSLFDFDMDSAYSKSFVKELLPKVIQTFKNQGFKVVNKLDENYVEVSKGMVFRDALHGTFPFSTLVKFFLYGISEDDGSITPEFLVATPEGMKIVNVDHVSLNSIMIRCPIWENSKWRYVRTERGVDLFSYAGNEPDLMFKEINGEYYPDKCLPLGR